MSNIEAISEFRLQGEADLLFAIDSLGHQLQEDDVFTYSMDGGPKTAYKIESVRLELSQKTSVSTPPRPDAWLATVLKFEVSVVP